MSSMSLTIIPVQTGLSGSIDQGDGLMGPAKPYDHLPLIRSDHDLLRFTFAESQPNVHHLPHLVMPAWKRSLEIALQTVDCTGGVWGDYPRWDETGEPSALELGSLSRWLSWKASPNQADLREHGFHAKLGCFTAVIDVGTPWHVIESLGQSIPKNRVPFIDKVLPEIIRNIEALRWMYAPLSDEIPLALFVTASRDEHWVQRVEKSLQEERIPYTRIVEEGGRETWHLDDELRQLCLMPSQGHDEAPGEQ
jgi:hypothetical protein